MFCFVVVTVLNFKNLGLLLFDPTVFRDDLAIDIHQPEDITTHDLATDLGKNSSLRLPTRKQSETSQLAYLGGNHTNTNRDDLPLLLLHVGPHKTATSAIQCQLTHHFEHLKKASYVYSGRIYNECLEKKNTRKEDSNVFGPRSLVACLDNHQKTPCNGTKRWKIVDTILKEHSQNKINVIISDEAFSRFKRPQESVRLMHQLFTKFFRVRIVVGYRRYHEWVTSSYYHYVGDRLKKEKWPTKYLYRHGLEQGFSKDYSYFKTTHPADYLTTLYGSEFDDVRIFNIHRQKDSRQKQHLMTNFFEQIMDDEQAKSNSPMGAVLSSMESYDAPHLNIGFTTSMVNVLTLALAAQEWKLVPSNKKFKQNDLALNILNASKTKKLPSLYFDCLSPKEEEEFLYRSLLFEQKVLYAVDANHRQRTNENDTIHQRQQEQQHRDKFAAAKHCSVDVDKVVIDTEWKVFFQSL